MSRNERQLHEEVALKESHEAQTRGIVGFFYKMYTKRALNAIPKGPNMLILDAGCGEGMALKDTGIDTIQLDISQNRLSKAKIYNKKLVCGDAMQLPFACEKLDCVLLIALLEHVSKPDNIISETHRVLKKGGRAIIVIPNDITLSIGRACLLKFPVRYPDHLSFITPKKIKKWISGRFNIKVEGCLPFQFLPFAFNLYYFMVIEKL